MNITIDSVRKVIKMTTEQKGWDNWLKVREDIKMTE